MRSLYVVVALILLSHCVSGQAGNYQSRTSGPWGTAATWDRDADGNGSFEESPSTVAPNTNTTAGTITIRNGHTVTVAANVTVDQTTIQSGGALTVNAAIILTLGTGAGDDINVASGGTLNVNGTINLVTGIPGNANRLRVFGTLNNNGVFQNSTATKFIFESGSQYFHLFDGLAANTVPTAAWNAASTVNITGIASGASFAPANLSQTFGNVIWNTPGMDTFLDLAGAPSNVVGNFQIDDTGAGGFYFNQGLGANESLTVNGNFIMNAGTFGFIGQPADPGTLSIGGNLELNGGYFQIAEDINAQVDIAGDLVVANAAILEFSAAGATGAINLEGDYTYSGGDVLVSAGVGQLNFIGSSGNEQIITSTLVPVGAVDYLVSSLAIISLPGSNFLAGPGTFQLDGTMRLGSTAAGGALQQGTTNGAIRVPTANRTYTAGSTIEYTGTAAQFIGNGFPSGSDVNLTINNTGTSPANTVTLSTNLNIVALRVLTMTAGNIVIGTQTLTINGTVVGSGGIVGGPQSNLVIGGTGNFGTLTFNGTNQLLNFTLNRTSGGIVTMGGSLEVLGTLTQTAGDIVLGSNTLSISGNYSRASGNIVVTASSILEVEGAGTLPASFAFGASTNLGTLTIDRASATVTTNASLAITNLNLSEGTFANGTGVSITAGGTIRRTDLGSMANAPNNTTNAYNVEYNNSSDISSGPELPVSPNLTALGSLTKLGAGTLNLGGEITVNGTLTLSNGTFDAGTNDVTIRGNFVTDATSDFTQADLIVAANASLTTVSMSPSAPVFSGVTVNSGVSFTPAVSYSMNGVLQVDGTLLAGSATTTFTGTSSITGSGTKSFNNVSITGTLTAPTGNFNVAGNWNNVGTFNSGVASNTVTFNGTTTFTGAGLTQFSGIIVGGTVTSSSTLRVGGSFTVNGTFNHNLGTVLMNGATGQFINGSSPTTFYNLSCSNPSSVTVSTAGTNLLGALTLSAGTFNPSGNLTLVSLATSDARIAPLTGGATFGAAAAGNLIVQRYLPNTTASQAYRYLASPVTNATASQWKDDFPITGTFNDPSTNAEWAGQGLPTFTQTAPSMFIYNEAHTPTSTLEDRYESFPPNGSASTANPQSLLTNGRGYAAFVRQSAPVTLDVTGRPAFNNVPVNVTAQSGGGNDGWNLIANPYASPIDWDNVTRPGQVNAQIALLDNTNNIGTGAGSYVYYTQGGPGIPITYDGTIASGQAFWVRATANTTITFQEDDKAAVGAPSFIREGSFPDLVRVRVAGLGRMDELVLQFLEEATDAADASYDAFKLRNTFINFSSLSSDGKELAINRMGMISCSKEIPLSLKNVTAGAYGFTFTEFDSFTSDVEIRLLDNFTGNSFLVTEENPTYNFTVTTDPNTFGVNRFKLFVGVPGAVTSLPLLSTPACVGTTGAVTIQGAQAGVSYFATINGAIVSPQASGTGQDLELSINAANLSAGGNTIVVMSQRPGCDPVPMDQAVTLDAFTVPTITEATGASICGAGQVQIAATGSEGTAGFQWFESADATEAIAGQTSAVFMTPSIQKTKTYYVSAVNQLGCASPRVAVDASVSYPYEVTSVTGASTCQHAAVELSASGAPDDGSYRWYLTATGDNAIAGANASGYTTPLLTEPRTYYVAIVNAAGCEGPRVPVLAEVGTPPSVTLTNSTVSCGAGSVELTAAGATSGSHYNWYESATGAAIADATGATFTTPVLTTTRTYFVSITNGAGCESTRTPVVAQVTTLNDASISVSGQKLVSNYPSGNQWYLDGVLIEGATSQEFTPIASGVYKLRVTVGACETTVEKQFIVTGDIADIDASKYKVFPNPSTGVVGLEVRSKNPVSVRIFSTLGREVAAGQLQSRGEVQTGEFDITDKPNGIYILTIRDGEVDVKIKILKN